MSDKTYKIKNEIDVDKIDNLGFRYSRVRSDIDNPVYIYKFPVYKHRDTVLLEGWFTLYFNTGEIKVDVMDVYNGLYGRYAPFYYYEYGDYTPILDVIDKRINKELRRIGVEKIKEVTN